jgi:hypothetical protein
VSRKRSPEEQRLLSRMGGLLSAAQATPEQRSDRGRRSVRSQITKKVDPDVALHLAHHATTAILSARCARAPSGQGMSSLRHDSPASGER